MVFVGDIGNMTETDIRKKCFKWTVANFLSFLEMKETQMVSPPFPFESQQCALGLQIFENNEWIEIQFWISPKNYLIHVKLGVLATNGEEYKGYSVQYQDDDPVVHLYEKQCFLQKSELDKVLHSGQLTVFCEITQKDSEKEILQMDDGFDGILAA